jgi:ankyrin repeat protein
LRRSAQRNLRGILEKLPKTLDETYERVLKDINEDNREHARRLLHCLAVAIRPLRVQELAEILTFDFDDVEGGVPKFHADWRWKDKEEAVLSTCSSLISVVGRRGASPVVQFSHFSVKEFLVSDRLASSTPDVSRYHILHGPAHTILAQACLGFLLHLDDRIDGEAVNGFPLAKYAAKHWVAHAQFEGVASHVEDGMRSLFDPDKRHLVAWLGIYDIDPWSKKETAVTPNPLYYASLCGFHDLVEHLVINHPQLLHITCKYGSPLLAALSEEHIRVAEFLLRHGGNDVHRTDGQTPLHVAIVDENVYAVSFLLSHGADVNSQSDNLWTPLHVASSRPSPSLEVAQMLLKRGADANSCNDEGKTPLFLLLDGEYEAYLLDFVQLLLEHGANANIQDKDSTTPLVLATKWRWHEIARVLLEHGADPNLKNNDGVTPLHLLLDLEGYIDEHDLLRSVQLFLEHGANVNAQDKDHTTPLHLAMKWALHGTARALLDHGAEPNSKNDDGKTPLHLLIDDINYNHIGKDNVLGSVQLLLERGADVNEQDQDHTTPLHLAMKWALHGSARVLLERGAEPNVRNDDGKTPLHLVFESKYYSGDSDEEILRASATRLLLEHGADVNSQDKNHITPLLLAIRRKLYEVTRLLLVRGANPNVKNVGGKAPLHLLLDGDFAHKGDIPGLVHLLLDRGADVNTQDRNQATPLLLAMERHMVDIARILLDRGAEPNLKNIKGKTPLHLLLERYFGIHEDISDFLVVERLLLERGADVNAQDEDNTTPLNLASNHRRPEFAQIIFDHHDGNGENDRHPAAQVHVTLEGE